MATPSWFTNGIYNLLRGSIDFDNDTFKLMLTAGTYVPSQANDASRTNCTAFEASVQGGTGGYSAGGWTLTSPTLGQASPSVNWDVGDLVQGIGGTLAFRYGIFYKSTGTPATDWLVGYVDFGAGGTQTVINSTLNITNTNPFTITVS